MSDRPILTTRQGHPVRDNQSLRSVGERGPATLENYQFIEKITHFDRERIPERVVHARGTGAHGYFEAYGKIGDEPASTPVPRSSPKSVCRRRPSCASRP
jgi:catalase